MSRDPRVYLEDILEAAGRVRAYVAESDKDGLAADSMRLDAVIRNLEVIGEAVKCLPDALTDRYPDVDWRKIAGLRDILIHHYFGIDLDIIWDVVESKLPELESAIRPILGECDDP